MQHTAAMRYGHFPARAYVRSQFREDAAGFRLLTDWHRYAGRHRYCLRFDMTPAARFRWYRLVDTSGEVVADVSAAPRHHQDQLLPSSQICSKDRFSDIESFFTSEATFRPHNSPIQKEREFE